MIFCAKSSRRSKRQGYLPHDTFSTTDLFMHLDSVVAVVVVSNLHCTSTTARIGLMQQQAAFESTMEEHLDFGRLPVPKKLRVSGLFSLPILVRTDGPAELKQIPLFFLVGKISGVQEVSSVSFDRSARHWEDFIRYPGMQNVGGSQPVSSGLIHQLPRPKAIRRFYFRRWEGAAGIQAASEGGTWPLS